MNKKEKEFLESIVKDCNKLKRMKDLTEFGKGQLFLAKALLKRR